MKTEDNTNPLNTNSAKKRNSILLLIIGLISIFAVLFGLSQFGLGNTELIEAKLLQPSDENYPKVNQNPKQVVKFTAIMPEGWPTEFTLEYSVTTHQVGQTPLFLSSKGCPWTQRKPFWIKMPLQLKRQGENYEGTFAIDYFEPGICDWQLSGIHSSILTYWLGLPIYSSHTSAHPDPKIDLENKIIHKWCSKNGIRKKHLEAENQIYDCTSFDMLSSTVDPPPGFEESIPENQKEGYLGFTQYMRVMKVEFHDTDRAIDEYVQRQSK